MTQSSNEQAWRLIATLSEFASQRKLAKRIDGIEVLLCRLGAAVVAVQNRCTHLGMPLERGRVMGVQIMCPFHGACFDLNTGAVVDGPAVFALKVYPIRIDGDRVFARLENASDQIDG